MADSELYEFISSTHKIADKLEAVFQVLIIDVYETAEGSDLDI